MRSFRRLPFMLLALLLVAGAVLSACADREEEIGGVELPETPIVSVRDRRGVVMGSYVRVREEAARDAAVRNYVRRGLVVEVTEVLDPDAGNGNRRASGDAAARRSLEPGEDFWVRIRAGDVDGWVQESDLSLYESRTRARNAARELTEPGEDP